MTTNSALNNVFPTTSTTTASTFYPLMVASSSNSNQALNLATQFNFNPSTGLLTTQGLTVNSIASINSALNLLNGCILRGGATNGHTYTMAVWDGDDATYKTFMTATAGNTPALAFAQPAGSTLTWDGGAIGSITPAAGAFTTLSASTPISLASGGSNANLTANNGGIIYSTATAMAVLAGTATAGKILQSGSSAAPSWSTPTYPSSSGSAGKILRADGTNNVYSTATFADTYTASNLLYSNGSNTVTGLATANNGTLITSSGGVPSISSTLPSAVQDNITRLGTLTVPVKNTGQPAFLAQVSTTITDVTGDGTTYTVIFGNEIFDRANEYNPATGTFTASQTGLYQISLLIFLSGLTASHSVAYGRLVTTAKQYLTFICNTANCRDNNTNYAISYSMLIPMTAGDTATANVTVGNGTKVVDVASSASDSNSLFSAVLVC